MWWACPLMTCFLQTANVTMSEALILNSYTSLMLAIFSEPAMSKTIPIIHRVTVWNWRWKPHSISRSQPVQGPREISPCALGIFKIMAYFPAKLLQGKAKFVESLWLNWMHLIFLKETALVEERKLSEVSLCWSLLCSVAARCYSIPVSPVWWQCDSRKNQRWNLCPLW